MKWGMLAGLIALAGCNAYHPISADAVVPDENTVGRQCVIETASPAAMFGLIGALVSYQHDKMALDACMAQHGWVRN